MPNEFGKPIGPLLAVRHEMPPTPFTRAQAKWLMRRHVLMHMGGYELGNNDGPLVRIYHRVTNTSAGDPWCAALQMFCMFILGGQAPLSASAYCPAIGDEAKAKGILDSSPEADDLVLFWHLVDGVWRFGHIGYILSVNADGSVETAEGNTNNDGGREGWQECKKTRTLGENDRVVHWHRLIPE